MKDATTILRVGLLHPKIRDPFSSFITDAEDSLGIIILMVQGFRTFEEQTAIYNQGRTTPGEIVTYSPAGASYHNYGLAGDCCPYLPNSKKLDWKYDFKKLKPFAVKYSLTCGIDFPHPDSDHFENKFGYNWRDLLHKYHMKDFIPGTNYLNI